jgi:hypothetical protein
VRRSLVIPLVVVLVACTSGSTPKPASAPYPRDDGLRLNDIQVLGSHNSYHVLGDPKLLTALRAFDKSLADSLDYGHAPLDEQFDADGVRQIELDVFADPNGRLFANRGGQVIAGGVRASGEPALDQPGFKVLHVQDIDFASTCLTFVACLTTVRGWSKAHRQHVPIMIDVEVKQDAIPDPLNLAFAIPHAIGPAELDALDAEIRSVLGPEQLITPDDVRGAHATLEEAITTDGWPTLASSRGKLLFTLDNEDKVRDDYVAGHPALKGRVLFTSSPRGTPEAAFLKLNDPTTDGAKIRQAVLDGYVVRTRSDADTVQARTGDTTMREAALRSGAQWVSTDYEVADTRFGTGYVVAIPGGTPARCNPVRNPSGCSPSDIENPAHLTGS